MKELYLLMEEEELNAQHSDNKSCTGDSWTQNTVRSQPFPSLVHSLITSSSGPSSALGTGAPQWHCLITGSQLPRTMEHISYPRALTEGQMVDCKVTGKQLILVGIWRTVSQRMGYR